MILSQLGYKEIINLNNGERLGLLADSDIYVEEKKLVKSLLFFSTWKEITI